MSPANRQLQPGPEALDAVDMVVEPDVFSAAVVDPLMPVADFCQAVVGFKLIRVDGRAFLHVLMDVLQQRLLPDIRHNFRHDLAAAFQHPEYNGFPCCAAPGLAGPFTADVGFVGLNVPVQRPFVVHLGHKLANLMRHAPRALVRNSELALQFLCRYAMPGGGEQEHGIEPLVNRGSGALHRCAYARVNVVFAMLAEIRSVTFQAVKFAMLSATGAVNFCAAVSHIHDMKKASFIIGELLFKLVKCCHFKLPWLLSDEV